MLEPIKESNLVIDDMLGSGSFGDVYKGKWKNREVAVKFVLRAKRSEVECIGRLVALKHPHLVTIYGLCENVSPPIRFPRDINKEYFCIVMEYCGRRTLRDIISDKKSIQKNLFLIWISQITSAMIYLHEQKLLHRDLKPENILLLADDSLKLCDFGTVREWKGATTSMTFCGTVRYMAPEVLQGKQYSHKADVWSFGVILWEMLVQQLPYEEPESPAIIYKIGKGELDLPVLNIPKNIDSLSLLLKECLDRDFHQRASYNEIHTILERTKKQISSISENEWFEIKTEWRVKYAKNIGCSSSNKSEQSSQSYEKNEYCIMRFDEFHECYWNKPNLIAFIRVKVDTTIHLWAVEICGFIEKQNFKHEDVSVQLRSIHTNINVHVKEIENETKTMKIIFSERCELIEETPYELSILATVPNMSKRYCCLGEGETTIRIRNDRSVTFVFNEDERDPQTIIGFYLILPSR